VQEEASDGFILVPHLTPAGLDPFVDKVVPLLQERGVFRTADPAGQGQHCTTIAPYYQAPADFLRAPRLSPVKPGT
jgi:hypothetical protein